MEPLELFWGYDPMCPWCFALGPAITKVQREHPDLPIRLLMSGLVKGDLVGPYNRREGYYRQLAPMLMAEAGREPSEAFYALIARDGVTVDSAPPSAVLGTVMAVAPKKAASYAVAMGDAHFLRGEDLNDPATHQALFAELGIEAEVPPLEGDAVAEAADAVWAEGRRRKLTQFPVLALVREPNALFLPKIFQPASLVAFLIEARRGATI